MSALDDLTVACYTFPHYHRSALNDRLYGKGWTEYVVLEAGRPWFPGHDQPRRPLLGELDERDPETWARYNDLAARHGIDVWIWDTYWLDDGPAFHEALEEGFLRSPNRELLRFAVMWTNHPWTTVFPTTHVDGTAEWPPAFEAPDTRQEDVWRSLSYLIARYLHLPEYWRIEGMPVVCIWEATRLLDAFGDSGTRDLLEDLRAYGARLGHERIHFHVCFEEKDYGRLQQAGFDSYGYYQPVVHAADQRPRSEEIPAYDDVVADVIATVWPQADAMSELPFFPSVNPGWDTTPRFELPTTTPSGDREVWPGLSHWGAPKVVRGDTPGAFEAFVNAAVGYARGQETSPRVLTIGCWNEWTEGHYLLPDTRFGYGMLEALASGLGRTAKPR